ADLRHHQGRSRGGDRRDAAQARRPRAHARHDAGAGQGSPHLPARRSRSAVRRADGRARAPAHRRLRQGGARRQRRRARRGAGCRRGAAGPVSGARAAMFGPDLAPRPSLRLWIVAVVGAVALHAGGIALALASLSPEEAPDDLGAPAIEIGVELMAPRAEPADLPIGPQTDASAASPPVVEQKAEVKPTDLPTDGPTETEDPDRLATTPEAQRPNAAQ